MNLEPNQPFALWLLPAQPWADQLENTIADLAQRHESRAFLPHVTLCSGPATIGADVESGAVAANHASALEALARRWRPLQLKSDGLGWGDDRFTFLYLRLHQPPGADLIEEAQQAFALSHGPAVGLHLSLLYGNPSLVGVAAPIDRPALAAKLAPRLIAHSSDGGIGFDRLALVQPGPGGWCDGWPWSLKVTHALGGS